MQVETDIEKGIVCRNFADMNIYEELRKSVLFALFKFSSAVELFRALNSGKERFDHLAELSTNTTNYYDISQMGK